MRRKICMRSSTVETSRKSLATLLLTVVATATAAQPHEATRGDLTLRSSTVASSMIDSATASRHGIDRAPDVGVLNVLLARAQDGRLRPVPARVDAQAWSLSGVRQTIEMREVREDGRISYVGTYDFLPREVIDFRITATPLDARLGPALARLPRPNVAPLTHGRDLLRDLAQPLHRPARAPTRPHLGQLGVQVAHDTVQSPAAFAGARSLDDPLDRVENPPDHLQVEPGVPDHRTQRQVAQHTEIRRRRDHPQLSVMEPERFRHAAPGQTGQEGPHLVHAHRGRGRVVDARRQRPQGHVHQLLQAVAGVLLHRALPADIDAATQAVAFVAGGR